MQGHDGHAFLDDRFDVVEIAHDFLVRVLIHHRIVVPGDDALPQHHLQPTLLREELVVLPEDPAVTAKQIDLHPQSVGDLHAAAVIPERRIIPLRGFVVEHEEVSDIDIFLQRVGVEAVDLQHVELA